MTGPANARDSLMSPEDNRRMFNRIAKGLPELGFQGRQGHVSPVRSPVYVVVGSPPGEYQACLSGWTVLESQVLPGER